MGLKDFMKGIFAGKPAKGSSLENISRELSELRAREEALRREDVELETREKQILSEGREASSPTTRAALAGKLADVRTQRRRLAQRLVQLTKRININRDYHAIREDGAFYEGLGTGKGIAGVSIEEMNAEITKSATNIMANVESLGDTEEIIADARADIDEILGGSERAGNPELDAILAEFDAEPSVAAEAAASGPDDGIFLPGEKNEGEKEK